MRKQLPQKKICRKNHKTHGNFVRNIENAKRAVDNAIYYFFRVSQSFSLSLNSTSFITAIVASVNAQGTQRFADADPKYVATQEGQSINLMCRIALPITSCRFIIPGEVNEVKLNPSWTRNDNFRYYGNGLENGQCGVTILNVREEYHGNVTCRLDPNDGQADAIGTIEIGERRKLFADKDGFPIDTP